MPPVIGALAVPRGRGFFRAWFGLEQCFVRACFLLDPFLFGAVLLSGLRLFSGLFFVWAPLFSAKVYVGPFFVRAVFCLSPFVFPPGLFWAFALGQPPQHLFVAIWETYRFWGSRAIAKPPLAGGSGIYLM